MGEPREPGQRRTLQADVRRRQTRLAHYLAEACVLFPQADHDVCNARL